jgi:transcriptional regulator with XRE-family HTH domain
MKNLGQVIKLERLKRNMKQISLAQGICTPSYLSKIENNSITPSQEVMDLLLQRLELTISQKKNVDDESYLTDIHKVYFEALMNKSRPFIQEKLQELNKEQVLFHDVSNYYTYQLILLRLELLASNSLSNKYDPITPLEDLVAEFTEYQSYLYYVNAGIFYSQQNNHADSLVAFEKAITFFQLINLEQWEEADFNYLLAECYLVHQRWVISVEYIQHALAFFKNGFYNSRVVECYLILSIALDKSHKTDEAFENLVLAQKICAQLNLHEHIPVINQGLGTLLSTKGEFEEAIRYFKESLEIRTEQSQKLQPIFSLIKEYSKLGKPDEVIHWSSLGLDILKSETNTSFQNYFHHFTVYKARSEKDSAYENKANKAIQFFKDIKDYRYAQKYSLFLAEYYTENTKYKNAAKYYALSNDYLFLKQDITFWEDL